MGVNIVAGADLQSLPGKIYLSNMFAIEIWDQHHKFPTGSGDYTDLL